MSRRRIVGVVVALAAVLALVLWHRSRSTAKPTPTTAARHKTGGTSVGGLAANADPKATKHVAGTVFLDNAPAAGASVHLIENRGIGAERAVQTDAAGHFDFGAVVVGRYFVVAELAKASGASLSIDLRNPVAIPAADQLRLVAHACEAQLHGVVRDASGGTIAKARIMSSDRGVAGPGTESNDDGSYELCVDVGGSNIVVRADGYADVSVPITAFGKLRRDFDLVPEAIVAGRALRADDKSPVENARIMLVPDRPGFGGASVYSAVSDSEGRFRFHGVARGAYSMSATASHLVTTEPIPVNADVSAPVEDADCVLTAALSVSGRVVDKKKNPIVGASVSIQPDEGRFTFAMMDEYSITETDGSFFIDHLTPGDYRARVSRYALAKDARRITIDKKDLTNVVLEVDPLGSIAGRVTRAGKPVEGADVSANPVEEKRSRDWENFSNMSTKSDADGKFLLRGVPADTYRVYAQSERVGAFTKGPEIKLGEAEAKTGVDLEMDLAGSIAGVVVDQNDAPVPGVFLRFSLLHGEDGGQATTAEDGSFKAGALSGGGDYVFEILPAATSAIQLRPVDGKRFPPIAVKDGNTQVTGVRIKVKYERLSISGRVLASNGEGAADVAVTAQQEPERGWASPLATTDTSGRFTIRDLPAGNYTIRAQAANASQRVRGVAAGAKGIELRLPGLGSIEGTLVGFTKPPSVMAFMPNDDDMMGGMPQRATIAGSKFTFTNVPVGTYSLMARSDDGYATGEATVAVGAKATVTLTNKGVGTVEGRVVDDKGAPVADIRCMGGGGRGTMTDSDGRFKLEHVQAGDARISCYGPETRGSANTTLAAGGTAQVNVVVQSRSTAYARSYAGLEFETRLSDVVVAKVEAGGPGDKAGIKPGDALQKIGDRGVDGDWGADNVLRMLEVRPPGTELKLTIERDDKEQTVTLKLDPPHASSE